MKHDIREITGHFRIPGTYVSAEPHGNGHIHDTYAAVFTANGGTTRYIVQRINHHVFKQPDVVMNNIRRVTDHLRMKLLSAGVPDADRRSLSLISAADGAHSYRDPQANTWRVYRFIEDAVIHETVHDARLARELARAVGEFQAQVADLAGERLHETIPDFHHSPRRFAALRSAITADTENRCRVARPEIEFALRHEDVCRVLVNELKAGRIPERITHNDTKVNNVMFDEATGRAVCLIDLDTVMPGLALYDFGDMVRTAASTAEEDERDLSRMEVDLDMFQALSEGYLGVAGGFLNAVEKRHLAFSGKLITFEVGIRFLTDFLMGDQYFKIDRPMHNLERCRTQFKLVESMIHAEDRMERIVDSCL